MIRTLLALLFVALVFPVAHSSADVAPPDDYKELCTLERTCPKGNECVLCPANRSDIDACTKVLGEQGFAMKCKSWGASAWREVWCRDVGGHDASMAAISIGGSSEPLKIERCSGSSTAEADSDCSCRAPGAQSQGDDMHYLLLGCAAAVVLRLSTRTRRSR